MSDIEKLSGLRVGFAVCGSFCTFAKVFEELEELVSLGCEVTPIMSHNAYTLDTLLGTAQQHAARQDGTPRYHRRRAHRTQKDV